MCGRITVELNMDHQSAEESEQQRLGAMAYQQQQVSFHTAGLVDVGSDMGTGMGGCPLPPLSHFPPPPSHDHHTLRPLMPPLIDHQSVKKGKQATTFYCLLSQSTHPSPSYPPTHFPICLLALIKSRFELFCKLS